MGGTEILGPHVWKPVWLFAVGDGGDRRLGFPSRVKENYGEEQCLKNEYWLDSDEWLLLAQTSVKGLIIILFLGWFYLFILRRSLVYIWFNYSLKLQLGVIR